MVHSHLNTTHIRARRVYACLITKTPRRLVIRLPNISRTKHYSLCLTTYLTNPATRLESDTALQLTSIFATMIYFPFIYISPTPSPSSVPYHHTPLPPTPSTHHPAIQPHSSTHETKPLPIQTHTPPPPPPQFTSPTSQNLHDLSRRSAFVRAWGRVGRCGFKSLVFFLRNLGRGGGERRGEGSLFSLGWWLGGLCSSFLAEQRIRNRYHAASS